MQIFQSNKGDIKYEKYIKYVVIITCFIFLWYFLWAMLTDISDNGRAVDRIENQFEELRSSQSAVEESIESVNRKLESSREQVNRIEESNNAARESTRRIKQINSEIEDSTRRGKELQQRSTEIIDSSEREIESIKSIISRVEERAEEVDNKE